MKSILKFSLRILLILLGVAILFLGYIKITEPKQIYPFNDKLGITALPNNLGSSFFKTFDRYASIKTPNGGAIHIVAQNEVTNEQIIRCKNILQHYLTDYKGSKYGDDKSEVANKMAENNAVLTLLNGQDDGNVINTVRVMLTGIFGQALYKNEIQVEGHDWYMNQNYEHRDASYEEILHFVHDNGIGVDGRNSFNGAKPNFQKEIRLAQINGLKNQLWAFSDSEKDWIAELEKENSLSQEYLASVIDSYYGLWGAWKHTKGGMWGIYIAKTRADIPTVDKMGYELMNNKFFHPYLTYNARIDANFKGEFSLKFDATKPYTHHSRYLKDITLLGKNDVNVKVNELDNDITGNAGNNMVIFSGKSTEYDVKTADGVTTVADKKSGRNGTNTLRKIERLQFLDKIVSL